MFYEEGPEVVTVTTINAPEGAAEQEGFHLFVAALAALGYSESQIEEAL